MSARVVVMALASVLLGSAPGWAQDRLFVNGFEVGAFGSFGKKLGPVGGANGRLVGGGRYTVIGDLEVADVRTGSVIRVPGLIVSVDPVRPRVFLYRPETREVAAWVLPDGPAIPLGTASSFRFSPTWPGLFNPEFSYAPGTDELFVRRGDGVSTARELAAIDATTGALKRLLPDPEAWPFLNGPQLWVASSDGRRIIAQRGQYLIDPVRLVSLDAVSGDLLAESNSAALTARDVVADPVFGLVLHVGNGGFDLQVFDSSLRHIGSFPTGYCGAQVRVSPHTGRIYLIRSGSGDGDLFPIDTRLTVVDGATGQVLNDVSVTKELGLHGGRDICRTTRLELRTAPGAPRNVRAVVAASTVSLSWTNIGDASNFVLDVGVAPGQTAASIEVGSASGVTFVHVPPGTYYVRVRGGNEFGGGRPSEEIVVEVK